MGRRRGGKKKNGLQTGDKKTAAFQDARRQKPIIGLFLISLARKNLGRIMIGRIMKSKNQESKNDSAVHDSAFTSVQVQNMGNTIGSIHG